MLRQREYSTQVAKPALPGELDEWFDKRGIVPDEHGVFSELPYKDDECAVDRTGILENVRTNAKRRDVPNLHMREWTPKIMVFVAGGPTLEAHLEEVRAKTLDEKYDVYTSNKTARYLLSNGIKPTYHLILDPQQSKVKDMDYEEKVDMILGLQCHPDLFDLAKKQGRKVEKFLAASVTGEDGVSDKDAAKDAIWEGDQFMMGIGGGSMTGTRMMYFAAARGYRRLEYYGFDGNVVMEKRGKDKDGREINSVKCYSYSKLRGENILEMTAANGRVFHSTMSLGRQGEELVSLLDMTPGLDVVIHGDSLLSNQLAIYREARKPAPYRITPGYLEQLKSVHRNKKYKFGCMGGDSAPRVFMAAAQILKNVGKCDVLDYGSGPGALRESIRKAFPDVPGISYFEYDPAIDGKDAEPKPAELVFCGDVMEHIEPECVDAVLKHIADLTKKVAIFVIALTPAHKSLPDGRNAHICLQKSDWWLSYIRKYFIVVENQKQPDALMAVCRKLP